MLNLDQILDNLKPHWGDQRFEIEQLFKQTQKLHVGEKRDNQLPFDIALLAMHFLNSHELGAKIELQKRDNHWQITLLAMLDEYPADFSDHQEHLQAEAEYFTSVLDWLTERGIFKVQLELYPSNTNLIWIYIHQILTPRTQVIN